MTLPISWIHCKQTTIIASFKKVRHFILFNTRKWKTLIIYRYVSSLAVTWRI